MRRRSDNGEVEIDLTAEPAVASGPFDVMVVDPLKTVLAGLGSIIDGEADLEVVITASSAEEATAQLQRLHRKSRLVALVSLSLVGVQDAFWLIRRIRELAPAVSVVAMGENSERTLISRALFFGADGFLDKHAEVDEFLEGIRDAGRGEVVVVGPPADWLGAISDGMHGDAEPPPILTERERQVLTLAAEGQTAREIGDELGLRERTVTTHFGRIYSRLGVHGRVAAISEGVKLGLIQTPGSAT